MRQWRVRSLVADTAKRILGDLADPQTVNRAKDDAWKAPAWAALEEAGLTLAWVPESLGGAGAELGDGFAVLREAGRNAAAVPLAETLLAGWLLTQAGIASPKGAMSCGPARDGEKLTLAGNGTLSGFLRSVAFAKGAKHLAVLARREAGGLAVALVEASQARITDGTGIGGDPLNAVSFNGARPSSVKDAPAGLDGQALLLMGAAARAMQMAGALEAILDLAVGYANERVAFERPIAKFQAVQHNLARLAGETAVAIAAAGSAADAIAHATGIRRGRVPGGRFRQDPRRRGGGRRCGHRSPGARRDRLHAGAHAAPLHASAVGVARRLRQRELLGGRARQHGRGQGRRRAVADAHGAVAGME